jgi:hypothetical protein
MINRDKVPELVAAQVGESERVEASSPASLEMAGQTSTECFAALTPNYLVLLCGPEGLDAYSYSKSEIKFHGSSFGATGKIFSMKAGDIDIKLGGLEMDLEKALTAAFPVVPPPGSGAEPPSAAPQRPPAASAPSYQSAASVSSFPGAKPSSG